MSFWVYVLKSKHDESHYVGNAQNIDIRLKQHNQGRCRYTKGRRPWLLVYREEFRSRRLAVQRERFLKSGVGRKELKFLILTTITH
jgi:putative endonuclease